jgi:hypothetical protein
LLGNGSVNTFPQQQIHAATEELWDLPFSTRSVPYQKKVGDKFFPQLPVSFFSHASITVKNFFS